MSTQSRHMQIVHLLSAIPRLTHGQIAQVMGCSAKTVQRVAKKIKPDAEESERRLEVYRRLIHEQVTLPRRVQKLSSLVDHENAFVSLAALKRCDQITGIEQMITAKEPEKPAETRPMFVLPPGAHINVGILRLPEIDVTPEPSAPKPAEEGLVPAKKT